jgi:hypothetical protein
MTTTTTHVIIVTKKKIGFLGKDQACLEAAARKRDHLKDNCTKVTFPGLLFSTDIGFSLWFCLSMCQYWQNSKLYSGMILCQQWIFAL